MTDMLNKQTPKINNQKHDYGPHFFKQRLILITLISSIQVHIIIILIIKMI